MSNIEEGLIIGVGAVPAACAIARVRWSMRSAWPRRSRARFALAAQSSRQVANCQGVPYRRTTRRVPRRVRDSR